MKPILNVVSVFVALLTCSLSAAFAQRAEDKLRNSCAQTYCLLLFDGEITGGDARTIEQAIMASPHVVEMIEFASPGGDPFEALKIADVLNRYFVAFSATTCFQDRQCRFVGTSFSGGICASACALLYLASNERYGSEVYFHRPTFPADYFRSLSGQDAEAEYNTAASRLRDALRTHGVSESQVESIMSIPSATVVKLAGSYPSESAWLEEWLDAKCGNSIATLDPDPNRIIGSIVKNANCRTDATHNEQHLIQGK